MFEKGINEDLKNIKVYHLLALGIPNYADPGYRDIFNIKSIFVGPFDRKSINAGHADYIPMSLSETPKAFANKIIQPDITMVQVSPADEHGYHTLGVSVICLIEALKNSKLVLGEINPRMPRTFGSSVIHESYFDFMIENESELSELTQPRVTEVEKKIGQLISENLIEDGSTLQVGIGGIPDAVLDQCKHHKDLGVHTEMLSDGIIPLIENGNITNRFKNTDPGIMCSTFLYGSTKLYDYFNNNPNLS